jgi:hypothetical protein
MHGKGAMPPFPQIKDQDLNDLVTFVHESTQSS